MNTEHNLYAGDLTPSQAWSLLKTSSNSILVDVRTDYEWENIGTPDIRILHKTLCKLSWKLPPNMMLNPDFEQEISKILQANPNAELIFICKSGGRSQEAAVAMSKNQYICYNVLNGFEGIGGWMQESLPWRKN